MLSMKLLSNSESEEENDQNDLAEVFGDQRSEHLQHQCHQD